MGGNDAKFSNIVENCVNPFDVGFGGADNTGASVESFHPKTEGQNAILAIVNDQIDRGP